MGSGGSRESSKLAFFLLVPTDLVIHPCCLTVLSELRTLTPYYLHSLSSTEVLNWKCFTLWSSPKGIIA